MQVKEQFFVDILKEDFKVNKAVDELTASIGAMDAENLRPNILEKVVDFYGVEFTDEIFSLWYDTVDIGSDSEISGFLATLKSKA